jgi:hypothetical protein
VKRVSIAFAGVGLIAIFSFAATAQSGRNIYLGFTESPPDSKHIQTTSATGQNVAAPADSIDEDWDPGVIHLKGNVLLKVRANGNGNILIMRNQNATQFGCDAQHVRVRQTDNTTVNGAQKINRRLPTEAARLRSCD